MARTGFVTDRIFLEHLTDPEPERPERLEAIWRHLEESGLHAELEHAGTAPAELKWIEAVHAANHVDHVRRGWAEGVRHLAEDTPLSPRSFEVARHVVGGALAATDRIVRGEWDNAFLAARPPGHHAEHAESMGFCLFNTAVIAAHYARAEHGLRRVAILDWDVHHGNGSQHLTERDPEVFFASLHQYPHYPGTGAADERGVGDGKGSVLNCPMAAGSGEVEYFRAFEEEVLPALEAFRPDFMILSAGFDAHVRDPLSDTRLTGESYRRMTDWVLDLAASSCEGRVLSLLEGGYDLEGLRESALIHVGCLRSAPGRRGEPGAGLAT